MDVLGHAYSVVMKDDKNDSYAYYVRYMPLIFTFKGSINLLINEAK